MKTSHLEKLYRPTMTSHDTRMINANKNKRRLRHALVAGLLLTIVGWAIWSQVGTSHPSSRKTLHSSSHQVYCVAISPDGKLVASTGFRVVELWDIETAQCLSRRATTIDHFHVEFEPNGEAIRTITSEGETYDWEISDNRLSDVARREVNGAVVHRRLSPDGKNGLKLRRLTPGSVDITDPATESIRVSLLGHNDEVNDGAFSPDGETLATAGGFTSHPWPVNSSGEIRLWDVSTGRLLLILNEHKGAVISVVFSGDGTILASGSHDGTIKLWDICTLRKRWR